MSAFRIRRAELGHGPCADSGYINAGYPSRTARGTG
jgi:hypothetical protein